MKTIFFIRHAKSSWADMNLADIERPLNKRGLRDAPFMAKVLRGKNARVDLFISSPAVRAWQTAQYFVAEFGLTEGHIRQEPFLYHAFAENVLEYTTGLDNILQTVVFFGHNPTFTTLANHFSEAYIANVPTCGIVRVEANIDDWNDFSNETAQMTAFYYPKQYF